jgi:hypothetical protein
LSEAIREAFRKQAAGCRFLGAPFTAAIIETLADVLNESTETGARVLGWPGDPLGAALPLRLTGGLHALARSGEDTELSLLYQTENGDIPRILKRVLSKWDAWLLAWLDSPPQTNEVGRSGALMPGLMIASQQLGMPIELAEIGASAGLNLNLDRFHYRFGPQVAGPEGVTVRVAPKWDGPPPGGKWPHIIARSGNDQNPLDVRNDKVAAQLIAYCWPDQKERLARLEAAIALARANPVTVEPGDAADWLEAYLARPQQEGTARIVMHSVFWQYLPPVTQHRVENILRTAGARATASRPLGWLRFEPDPPEISPMQLRLTLWPQQSDFHLATCHPHGTSISWLAA